MKTTKQIAQEMVDELFPSAAKIAATGEQHAPMMALQRANGEKVMLLLPQVGMENGEKDIWAALFMHAAASPEISAVCLILEAWAKAFDKDGGDDEEMREAERSGKVRDLPGRVEAITFNIAVGADQFLCICEIKRDAGNTLVKGEIMDLTKESKGRFVRERPEVN